LKFTLTISDGLVEELNRELESAGRCYKQRP
jgi:hypothetical protein